MHCPNPTNILAHVLLESCVLGQCCAISRRILVNIRFGSVVKESIRVGLTGSPGVGKTTVSSFLVEYGFSVESVEMIAEKYECIDDIDPNEFANKMKYAFDIAKIDINRAVTHNKGIMNGIDAILIATGNDFRAVEANVHAYASLNSKYESLSQCTILDNKFRLSIEIPLSVGTVGGITDLHPLVKLSLKMLGNPSSRDFMCIVASVGLAQNFAAVKSLITSGIQKGHMRMHLINLLIKKNANEDQIKRAKKFFVDKEINNYSVNEFLKLNP